MADLGPFDIDFLLFVIGMPSMSPDSRCAATIAAKLVAPAFDVMLFLRVTLELGMSDPDETERE